MIEAVIFDLESSLIQGASLKAQAYGLALQELDPRLNLETIKDLYHSRVNQKAYELATFFLMHFKLHPQAETHMLETDAIDAIQALVRLQHEYYQAMLEAPHILEKYCLSEIHKLLAKLIDLGCRLGLSSSFKYSETHRLLQTLKLEHQFSAICSHDDITFEKPNPETFEFIANLLKVKPENCLVIEGSQTGIDAALTSNMMVLDYRFKLNDSSYTTDKYLHVPKKENLETYLSQLILTST